MTRTTKYCLMTIALLGSLALAACGDDDDSSSASFCDAAARYEDANSGPNPSTASPTELEATYTQLQDALDELRSTAPSEIEADVDTIATVFENFISAFAGQDYDYSKLMDDPDGQNATEALNSMEMGTAMGNINDYVAAECGTTTTGGS